ncbi:MAG TPA: hypothetical protein VNW54_02865 [Granulicella sp.]|jgi:hypothetical protein|nr:hypothetical protein [Granulicella sp.]
MDSKVHTVQELRSGRPATLFGAPIGDLGWFASLLMGMASGFAAFFAATFCGIIGILIANGTTHRSIDFSLSYRLVGLPVGGFVLLAAWSYLGTLWLRRQMHRG